MSDESTSDPREALEDVRAAFKELVDYRMQHAHIINGFESRQKALNEARDELAWSLANNAIDYVDDPAGELAISYTRSDRGTFNAEKLPADIRDNPDLTYLAVDKKEMKQELTKLRKRAARLRENGASALDIKRVNERIDAIEAAYEPNPSKPSVQVKPIVEK